MELAETFESKRLKYAWACFYAITVIGVYIMNRSGVGRITTVLTLSAVFWGVCLSLENVFLLITAVIPWGQVFKVPNGYTAATLLIFVFLVKSVVSYNKAMFHVSKLTFKIYASYLVCFTISIIAALSNNSNISEVIPFYMEFLFVIVCIKVFTNKNNMFEKAGTIYTISTLLMCFCSSLFPTLSRTLGNISQYSSANPGFSSPWSFGRITLVSISFIVVDYLSHHDHLLWKILTIAILLNYLIQSGRFSILLGLAFLVACLPIISKQKDYSIKQRVFVFIGMLALFIILLLVLYFFFYRDMVALRGTEASDNGRFELWKTYLHYLGRKPLVVLFGIGGGAVSSFGMSLNTESAHNILLEKLVELGVVGIVLAVYLFIRLYKSNKDTIRHNLYLIPLIAFLGTSLTQGTSGSQTFALLIILCMCKDNNEVSENQTPRENH